MSARRAPQLTLRTSQKNKHKPELNKPEQIQDDDEQRGPKASPVVRFGILPSKETEKGIRTRNAKKYTWYTFSSVLCYRKPRFLWKLPTRDYSNGFASTLLSARVSYFYLFFFPPNPIPLLYNTTCHRRIPRHTRKHTNSRRNILRVRPCLTPGPCRNPSAS